MDCHCLSCDLSGHGRGERRQSLSGPVKHLLGILGSQPASVIPYWAETSILYLQDLWTRPGVCDKHLCFVLLPGVLSWDSFAPQGIFGNVWKHSPLV